MTLEALAYFRYWKTLLEKCATGYWYEPRKDHRGSGAWMIDDCQARIRNQLAEIKGMSVAYNTLLVPLDGPPAETIVDVAQEIPHSLVLMTTHGRSELKRLMLGSVTDSVVRNAHGPVMVILSAS